MIRIDPPPGIADAARFSLHYERRTVTYWLKQRGGVLGGPIVFGPGSVKWGEGEGNQYRRKVAGLPPGPKSVVIKAVCRNDPWAVPGSRLDRLHSASSRGARSSGKGYWGWTCRKVANCLMASVCCPLDQL